MGLWKKIGITQRVHLEPNGERRDCLDQRWIDLLWSHSLLAVPLGNTLCDFAHVYTSFGLSGILLSGGNDIGTAPERDSFERSVIEYATKHEVPLLGVCRGMQMLGYVHGLQVSEVTEHVRVHHELQVVPKPVLPLSPRMTVNSFHGFGILESALKKPWKLQAKTADGVVEAMAHESLPQYGMMWHPERGEPTEFSRKLFQFVYGAAS